MNSKKYISVARNIMYLPNSILFFLLGFPLFLILLIVPKKRLGQIHLASQHNELEQRIDDIGDFITAADRVLDVGCGNGQFGEAIAKRLKADVCGVEVVDYANANIPVIFFDGVHLPFEDDSFDVIIMAMMLHHVEYQEELIDEAIRCSRRGLVIYEDTYFSPWQRLAVIWNDFYSNRVIGLVKVLKDVEGKGILKMPLPYRFRSVNSWQKLFAEKSLINENTIVQHLGVKPHSKVTFLLQKDQNLYQSECRFCRVGNWTGPIRSPRWSW